MSTIPRRAYLLTVGTAAVALPIGVVGAVDVTRVGRRNVSLDYDRRPNGDIDFDDPISGTRFRTRGDDLEFDDAFTRCREHPSRNRFKLRRRGPPGSLLGELDIERADPRSELRLEVLGEELECEFDGFTHEFSASDGFERLEDDATDRDIEYRSRDVDFEMRGGEIDIRRAIRFRFDGVDRTRLRDIDTDFRSDSGQFRSSSGGSRLRIDYDRATKQFDARRVA